MPSFIRFKLLLITIISLVIVVFIQNFNIHQVFAQLNSSPQIQALDTNLNNPSIYDFVESGFNYSQQLYGKPKIPVKKVNLRLYTRALTSLDNVEKGEFTIYLSRQPSEYAFHGQLAHEIFHLLNAQLFDCYVEGLASVFAEKMLNSQNLDWSKWETYYQQGNEPFYGLTYSMMKEVSEIVGSANMRRLLDFAVYNDGSKKLMHIDIDGWLSSMSDFTKAEVKNVINQQISEVKRIVAAKNNSYTCLELQ